VKKYRENRRPGARKNPGIKHKIIIEKDFCRQAASFARSEREKAAFLCFSDVHAIDLLKYFWERNIEVPRDAGIMGFDNLDILNFIRPRLTTTSTSIETVGQEAITHLFKLINKEPVPEIVYVPHYICPGETL
jgi:DNA-binding LacI/PurR family transcriptional regulator